MIVTLIRTAILYICVTFAIRLMGKRQIGDMQPNELVITLLISEIAAIPLQDASQPILNGVVAIFMLIILEITVSVISMKSSFFRRIMNGKSAVIIKDGIINQQAMRDLRLTTIDLTELLRSKDVFDINEIAFAVLEVNGEISIIKKPMYENVKCKDLKVTPQENTLLLPVVSDGKILKESLTKLQISENDVYKALGNENIKDIFFFTMDENKKAGALVRKDKSK